MTVIAAFDFDGTLTYSDTLLPFIFFCHGKKTAAWKLAKLAPRLALDVLQGANRQVMKERLLTAFFKDQPIETLKQQAEAFAAQVLPKHLKPEAMRRLRWHQQQGHRCILVSASVDLYLKPWVQQEGFDDLICSRLELDNRGRVTGKLCGSNCRAAEKVRRLLEVLGPKEKYVLYAYGDSRGDAEMLAFADYPFLKVMPDV